MSNVKVKLREPVAFVAGEHNNWIAPKIDLIKAFRRTFDMGLKEAKDIVEYLLDRYRGSNELIDVTTHMLNQTTTETYFDPKKLQLSEDYQYLTRFFHFDFARPDDGESAERKQYRYDVQSLMNQAIAIRRFDDARAILNLLEHI